MAVSRGRGRNGGEEEFGTDTRPGTNGIINRKKRKEIYSCRSNINSRLNFTFESGLKGCSRELLIFYFFFLCVD